MYESWIVKCSECKKEHAVISSGSDKFICDCCGYELLAITGRITYNSEQYKIKMISKIEDLINCYVKANPMLPTQLFGVEDCAIQISNILTNNKE